MHRRLSLSRETLRELGPAELAGVAAGQRTWECLPPSLLVGACVLPTFHEGTCLECFTGHYTG